MIATDEMTVKELAVEVPGTARVFEKLGIDYCCGGNVSLKAACERARLPLSEVLSSLAEAQAQPNPEADWSKAPLAALAQHIVQKHHTYTARETTRLESLFERVYAAHAERHPELGPMQGIFRELAEELRSHMMKEENILFPYLAAMENAALQSKPIPRAMFGTVQNPVRMMTLEHDSAGEALRALREASHGYAVPEDACASYAELYRSLAAFEADLHTHIHLENNILFPRALALEAASA